MGRLSCLTGTRRSRCDSRFTGHLGQLLWSLLIFVIDAFLSYFGCAPLSHVSRTQWLLCAGFFFGFFCLWGFLAPPILHFVYPWFGLALPWHSADPLLYLRFSWHLPRLRVGYVCASIASSLQRAKNHWVEPECRLFHTGSPLLTNLMVCPLKVRVYTSLSSGHYRTITIWNFC